MCKCRASTAAARAAAERTAASIPGPQPVSSPQYQAPRPVVQARPVAQARPASHQGRVYLNHWGRRIESATPVSTSLSPLTPVSAVATPVAQPSTQFIRSATRTLAVARTQNTHPQLNTFLNLYANY